MPMPTDVRPVEAALYLLPIRTRVPLKFGPEVTTEVTCARVRMTVTDRQGRRAEGWGETPLSVQWVWPSDKLSYTDRLAALVFVCRQLTKEWVTNEAWGHPIEIGHTFIETTLAKLCSLHALRDRGRHEAWGASALPNWEDEVDADAGARLLPALKAIGLSNGLPKLAALVCNSPFDIALHDAYGILHGVPTYETYRRPWMNQDLTHYLEPADNSSRRLWLFGQRFPDSFLDHPRPGSLVAWHLVGGKDPLEPGDLTGAEPDDGYPILLRDWIRRDGLKCLKVKLTGTDDAWDYERLVRVGSIGVEEGCDWLSADFNCTVQDPAYVNAILDRLLIEHPRLYGMILYVEQPFPYELKEHPIDVRSVVARKPLFMDESAHDWKLVRLGRSLGWSGVALKTCKTLTGALLSLCWAKAHGMTLMVQDLTNPMLAQIPHVLLAAHAGTIMGVETNGMQFYPEASKPEAQVHPGLYQRRQGRIDLSSIQGPGFGYRLGEIERTLPEPAVIASA